MRTYNFLWGMVYKNTANPPLYIHDSVSSTMSVTYDDTFNEKLSDIVSSKLISKMGFTGNELIYLRPLAIHYHYSNTDPRKLESKDYGAMVLTLGIQTKKQSIYSKSGYGILKRWINESEYTDINLISNYAQYYSNDFGQQVYYAPDANVGDTLDVNDSVITCPSFPPLDNDSGGSGLVYPNKSDKELYELTVGVPIFDCTKLKNIIQYLIDGSWDGAENEDQQPEEDNSQDGADGDSSSTSDTTANEDSKQSNTMANIKGACNMYVLSEEQTTTFFNWFWNDMIDEQQETSWIKYILQAYGDLRQNIVSIRQYPFRPKVLDGENIVLGRYQSSVAGALLDTSDNLVYTYSAKIEKTYKNFVDYLTQIYIYLPYYGITKLSTAEVMDRTVNVKYYCDYTTGGCDIFIFVEKQLLQHLTCSIGANVMYSMDSGYSSNEIVGNHAINLAKDTLSTVATMGGGTVISEVGNAVGGVANQVPDLQTKQDTVQGQLPSNGNIGCFNTDAYVHLMIPRYLTNSADKSAYGHHIGFCCYKKLKLSKLSGWTMCENPIVNFGKTKVKDADGEEHVVEPTNTELTEIYNYLQNGVII